MKRFEPSRTYSSPSRRAVVRIAAESEPEPDSVRAYAVSATAVFLGEEELEDIVLAKQLDDVPRELVRGVDLRGAWRDSLARELPDEVAQVPLLVAQDVPRHAPILGRGQPTRQWRRC